MTDTILNLLVLAFGKVPVGVVLAFAAGWWARRYTLKRNPALIAQLDAEANELIDKGKAKLDQVKK